jgi:hypothetical protein
LPLPALIGGLILPWRTERACTALGAGWTPSRWNRTSPFQAVVRALHTYRSKDVSLRANILLLLCRPQCAAPRGMDSA